MLHIKKHEQGSTILPGYYKKIGEVCVLVCCPSCHTTYRLNHSITIDGKVSPSVECPTEGCTFHEHITLDNYS